MLEELNNDKLKKGLKRQKRILVGAIVFLIIAVLSLVWLYFASTRDLGKPTNLHQAIYEGLAEGEYVELTLYDKPYSFAVYDNDNKHSYFFLYDNEYRYVGYLSNEEADMLSKIDYDKETVTIKGITKSLPNDIKKIGIDAYKEWYGEDTFNDASFEDYFGYVYIDTVSPLRDTGLQLGLLIFSLVIFILLFISYLNTKKKTKKNLEKYTKNELAEVIKEIDKPDVLLLDKNAIYLTENYIVDVTNGIDIIKYSDILWLYPYELKQYGITTVKSIIIYTNDKVKHTIGKVNALSKKDKKVFDNAFNFIYEKNSKILIGYTKENKQEMKDLYNIK